MALVPGRHDGDRAHLARGAAAGLGAGAPPLRGPRSLSKAPWSLPLVLPPTVLGYYLLLLIGSRGPVGRVLGALGIELAFTWRAAVLAACVGSIALLSRPRRRASSRWTGGSSRRRARSAAPSGASSGPSRCRWRGGRSSPGTVLAFCRALGDFGITLMVAGSIPGLTQTMPLAIYDRVQANQMDEANVLALIAVVSVTAPPDGARAASPA